MMHSGRWAGGRDNGRQLRRFGIGLHVASVMAGGRGCYRSIGALWMCRERTALWPRGDGVVLAVRFVG